MILVRNQILWITKCVVDEIQGLVDAACTNKIKFQVRVVHLWSLSTPFIAYLSTLMNWKDILKDTIFYGSYVHVDIHLLPCLIINFIYLNFQSKHITHIKTLFLKNKVHVLFVNLTLISLMLLIENTVHAGH